MLIALLLAGLPVMVAHRGGMAERPQNTLAAFDHALQLGAAMIEFDMGVTKDDEIVIHHDSSVNGRICTSATVKPAAIRTLTLAQIKTFDCGQGQRMPTLDEVLKRFRNSKVEFLAETKMDGSVEAGHFAKLVAAKVKQNGLEKRFILQSGDYDTLAGMRRAAPLVRICLVNARRFKPRYKELVVKYKAEFIMLRLDDVTDEGLAELRAMGVKIISSTANSPDQWAEYRRRGFDAILTDEPSAVMRFLSESTSSPIIRQGQKLPFPTTNRNLFLPPFESFGDLEL